MAKYRSVFFASGEESRGLLELLDEYGPEYIVDYIIWITPCDSEEIYSSPPYGDGDTVHYLDEFILSYNTKIEYISLCRVIPD